MHALALRAFEAALEDLESYLRDRPNASDKDRVAAAIRLAQKSAGKSLN
jgi:hypothetical protein